MVSFIARGVRRAQYRLGRRFFFYMGGPTITALIVVALLWLLPAHFAIPASPSVYELLIRGLHWLRVFIEVLLPWPATLIAIAALFFASTSAFGTLLDIFGVFRKFRIFGAEIELNEQTKRKLQVAASDISGAMNEYKARVNSELYHLLSRHQVDRSLATFVDDHAIKAFDRENLGERFRCTIHVPDPVQEGQLYQLLDYYPKGSGSFRSYSERFGIIGKVWRSEKSQIVGTLLSEIDAPMTREDQISVITRDWGMTKREAEKALERPSYACFLLEHDGDKLGVLYMDSELENAFTQLDTEIRKPMTVDQLDAGLRTIANEIISPRISKLLNDLADVSLRITL